MEEFNKLRAQNKDTRDISKKLSELSQRQWQLARERINYLPGVLKNVTPGKPPAAKGLAGEQTIDVTSEKVPNPVVLPKGDTPTRVDRVDAPLPVVPEKVDGGVPGSAAREANGVPILREGDGSPTRTVKTNVDRTESMKPEIAATLETGSTRVNHKGGVETLTEVPLDQVDFMVGNELFPDAVQKYVDNPGHVAPEFRIQENGRFLVYDGAHRTAAALQRGEKTIRAWTSRSGPDGYSEVPE